MERLLLFNVIADRDVNQGGFPMASMGPFTRKSMGPFTHKMDPFARKLSVVAAYLAFALVGAIVLGVI